MRAFQETSSWLLDMTGYIYPWVEVCLSIWGCEHLGCCLNSRKTVWETIMLGV